MERYNRHKNLFTQEQFDKIQRSSILVAGAGGLGCSVLQLLVRLGIGKIYIYDFAYIDLPDLNRQILYTEDDIGKLKAKCASEKLTEINSEIEIIAMIEKIDSTTSFPKVDLVIDCLDNFHTRYKLDQILYPINIPLIHGGVFKYYSQITSIVPNHSKSLQDLFPVESDEIDKEKSKDIFPPVVMATASAQVSEAIKYLSNRLDQMLINKVLMIDLLSNTFEIVEFK